MLAFGMLNADIMVSIDGVPLSSPERALEAFRSFGEVGTVLVEVERGSVTLLLEVRLRPC
jgi:type II secretory pathway component PulC